MSLHLLLWLGKNYAKDLLDEKSIFLLNAACLIWHGANLFLSVLGFSIMPEILNVSSLSLITMHTGILFLVQIMQWKGYLMAARAVFIVSAFMVFFIYDYFILPGYFISFYYIIPVLLSQLLFKEKIIHYALLLICIGLFFNFFTSKSVNFSQLHFINYFIALFFIVDMLIKINLQKQELLVKQKVHLEELNRFQSSFFVNLSHEIKTPLTLIQGAIARIKNGKNEEAEKLIEQQSNNINTLVGDMIALNKLQLNKLKLRKEKIDLSLFLKKIYASFVAEFERKGISFELELNGNYSGFYDPVYLERAINNILVNALKYTCSGEVVIAMYGSSSKKEVIIEINDSGIGISEKEVTQVMKRFYQADNSINKSSGTGIGLSFSQELIQLHGGALSLKSKEDIGTQVYLHLPGELLNANYTETKKSSVFEPINSSRFDNNIPNALSILVAEDNLDMQEYLARVLDQYSISFCQNGVEALEKLNTTTYDLLITDYMMPKMDGRELIREMNSCQLDLPVVMLTARSDVQDKLDLLRLGIDDYVTKPFNENELLARIKNLLQNFNARKVYVNQHKIDVVEETDSPFILALRNYIEENCDKVDFNVSLICEEFGLSNSSLYRKVKSHTGLNTQELIKEVKLKKAHSLILEKKVETIKEVTYKVGFSKPSYFTEVYFKTFGCKPFCEGQ